MRQKTALLLIAATLFSRIVCAFETNGDLDLTFDPGKFTNGQVQATLTQPDGKLVIAGGFGKVNGVARRNIARLNTDGSLDTSFDPAGSTDGTIAQLIRQTDGKFIIVGGGGDAGGGGTFSSFNGTARNNIARLNSDGSLDGSFDPGGLVSFDGIVSGGVATNQGLIGQVALQTDGKIVAVGIFAAIANGATTSAARSGVARFNSDGSFDAAYNPGTGFTDPSGAPNPAVIAKQSSGKMVIAGLFNQFNGNPAPGIARLNTDGSFDAMFTPGTGADDPTNVYGLYVDSSDRIMFLGSLTSFNGTPRNSMARLTVNGVLDSTFTPGVFKNYNSYATIEACIQQPDGKYLLGGIFYSLDGFAAGSVVRLNDDGTRDAGFDSTGTKFAGQATCFAKRTVDNEYFVGGYFSSYGPELRNNLALVKTDGTNDGAFPLTSGVTDFTPQIFAVYPQSDGKILVGGLFSSVNGQSRYNLVRLNADGSIDSTFANNTGASRSVRAFARQSSGKILVLGSFYGIDGVGRASVARLNNDGSLDLTFDANGGAYINSVMAGAVDAADNVFVGGGFNAWDGLARNAIVKLGSNGALDLTFNSGTGFNSSVLALTAPNGSAGPVAGGLFTQYNGTAVGRIARLDATTGALDTTFRTNGGVGFNGAVRGLTLRGDGKYSATGSFTNYNGGGNPRLRLARLNGDGTIDSAFVPNAGIVGTSRCLVEQNSKVDAGGNFTNPVNQLARYNSIGTRDTTLAVGSGLSVADLATPFLPEIDALAVQTDGKLLLGGVFSTYQGTTRFGLARLSNSHLRVVNIAPVSGHIRVTGTGDASTAYSLQAAITPSPGSFSEIGMVTTDGSGNWTYDDFSSPASFTKRFYRAAYY